MKIAQTVKSKVAGFSLIMMIVSMFTVGVAQAATFTDVQPTDWFYSYVEQLAADGVLNTSVNEFNPSAYTQRDQMAKLAVEAFKLPLENPDTPTFKDVPKTAWSYQYVETAYKNGVIGGYKDNTGTLTGYYGPGDSLTREQAMKIIVLAAPLTTNTKGGPHFSDVPASAWSYEYVETGYNWSVVDGLGDGRFAPNWNVRRSEIAKMISNAMNPVQRPGSGFMIDSATATAATTVDVCYSEAPKATEAATAANYAVADLDGAALSVSAAAAATDPMCVTLTTASQDSTKVYEVTVSNVTSDASAEALMLTANTAQFNGYSVGATGALTVRVDGSTPETSYIPQNGANILYSVFALDASADEDVRIEQLILTRQGLGLPGDFTDVKLYVDGVQLGGAKTVNATTNTATFNLVSTPIVVKAGTTSLVEVRGDMAGAVNSQNKFCIMAAADVTAYGQTTDVQAPVTASVPLCGNYLNTTSATVGTLTYTVSQPSAADINVGDKDVVMTKLRLDAAVEDVVLDKVMFKQTGSANNETDFANARLVVSGSALDVTPTVSGDYLTFDLTELTTPLLITKGSSKNVELWVDVVGGLLNTAAFDIYRDWHIEGTGQVYHYGVNVGEGVAFSPVARDIVGGNIAFALSSLNPITGDVAPGANDHEFLRFNVSTAGEAVTVQKMTLTVAGTTAADIEDLKIWTKNSAGNLAVVAGPNDVTALGDIAYTDSFDIPGGATTEYVVTADIVNGAVSTNTYSVSLASVNLAAKTEMEYTSTGDPVDVVNDVSGGVLTGQVQTVRTPAVDVTLAATPGDKTYVKNTTDRDLAAFDFAATTADDVKITALTVSCDPSATEQCAVAFQSLYLYEKNGSTLTKLDGPRSLGAAADGVLTTVTFSLNKTITAGNSARFLVRGNIASAAEAGTYAFTIAASTDVTAEDSQGAAATVNDGDGNYADAFVAVGPRTVTVATNGTVTDTSVSDTSTRSRILVGMTTAQPVLRVRFSASDLEAWYVRKLKIVRKTAGGSASSDADVSKVYLTYNDGTSTYTASANMSGGIAQFNLPSGHYVYVPANGNVNVDVSVDVGDVTVGGAVAGDTPQFSLDKGAACAGTNTLEIVGASSASLVCTTTGTVDFDGQVMRVARSAPTVARTDVSTTLADGTQTLYKWSVKADAANSIALKQMAFTMNVTGVTLTNFKLLRDGIDISTGAGATDVDLTLDGTVIGVGAIEGAGDPIGAGASLIHAQWNDAAVTGEQQISAGTTANFELKATVAGASSGDAVTTELANDTAYKFGVLTSGATVQVKVGGTFSNFVWSDLSLSPHSSTIAGPSTADWLDGTLVEGLSSIGSQVLSKS